MKLWLDMLIFALLIIECRSEDKVDQPDGHKTQTEGGSVTLECTFTTSSRTTDLFWYIQRVNDFPKYILRRNTYGAGDNGTEFQERFQCEVKPDSVPLIIHDVHVSDSAVYYCALKPQGINKIIFGEGVKLTVLSKEVQKPSFYKVNNDSCLATDFTQHNALDGEPAFSGQNISVRYDGEKTYSAFALGAGRICTETEGCKEGSSGQTVEVESDEKMNFMSLGIFWLRIVFLKTVVFNVLMTVKAWMS